MTMGEMTTNTQNTTTQCNSYDDNKSRDTAVMVVNQIETPQGDAWVIDNGFDTEMLQCIDRLRCSLKLDSKRPTVDRRFFSDQASNSTFFNKNYKSDGNPRYDYDSTCILANEDTNNATSNESFTEGSCSPSSSNNDDKDDKEEKYDHQQRPLASRIEHVISRSIHDAMMAYKNVSDCTTTNCDTVDNGKTSSSSGINLSLKKKTFAHVLRYQRFLEYNKVGMGLDPHTDGTKVCCDRPNIRSTHTMLLYLCDCKVGGETVLLKSSPTTTKVKTTTAASKHKSKNAPINHAGDGTKSKNKHYLGGDDDETILYSCKPKRGRILLFPHATLHAGMPVIDLPKICLRAEVSILRQYQHGKAKEISDRK